MNEDEVKLRRTELALEMKRMVQQFEESTGHKITALVMAGYVRPSTIEGAVVIIESKRINQ